MDNFKRKKPKLKQYENSFVTILHYRPEYFRAFVQRTKEIPPSPDIIPVIPR